MATRAERSSRPGKTRSAALAHRALATKGYTPLRMSWPTYLVLRPGGLPPVAVEALRAPEQRPDPAKMRVLAALAGAGIECWLFDPSTGFTRLRPTSTGGLRVEALHPGPWPTRGGGTERGGGDGGAVQGKGKGTHGT